MLKAGVTHRVTTSKMIGVFAIQGLFSFYQSTL